MGINLLPWLEYNQLICLKVNSPNSSNSSEEAVSQTDLDLFTFPAVCFIYSFQHSLVEKDSEKQRRTNFVFSIDSLRRLVLNSKHVKSGGNFFLREYFGMPIFIFVFLQNIDETFIYYRKLNSIQTKETSQENTLMLT